ncbi:proprotein convertase subtilisin/kexin type 9 [Syngnathoides biaculeatus]|uniref:proprotein convertase subtilisin/kexin type 9 n=1 Tax=Syngnathoides biaculeatus TaxID=300417 RepID=UPI002ADD9C0C|nr:proprotein convertase subtilisin/kexin type 9 [Syngnathoides biaculeatus]
MAQGKPYRYGLIAAGCCVVAAGLFIMTRERPHVYATMCALGGGMVLIGTAWSMCQCYPKVVVIPGMWEKNLEEVTDISQHESAYLLFVTTSSIKAAWRVPGRFLVILHQEGDVHASVRRLRTTAAVSGHQVEVLRTFFFFSGALRGFLVKMSSDVIQLLLNLPHVQYVEEDSFIFAQSAPWNLRRLLHPHPGDTWENATYNPPNDGSKAEVYLMDGGVRGSHRELRGRVVATDSRDILEEDAVKVHLQASRCYSHGTHIAGVVSGADLGVARGAGIHLVPVLNCHGRGSVSGALAGLDYIWESVRGASTVVLLPFVGAFSRSVNAASRELVASGSVVVAAAGNYRDNACLYSPASEPEVIAVGAVDVWDQLVAQGVGGTNFGPCVDLFAPGDDIISASSECDTCFMARSGTSQAAAHVAGIAAVLLSSNQKASPVQVLHAMIRYSDAGAVDVGPLSATNRLSTPNLVAAMPPPVNTTTSGGLLCRPVWSEKAGPPETIARCRRGELMLDCRSHRPRGSRPGRAVRVKHADVMECVARGAVHAVARCCVTDGLPPHLSGSECRVSELGDGPSCPPGWTPTEWSPVAEGDTEGIAVCCRRRRV